MQSIPRQSLGTSASEVAISEKCRIGESILSQQALGMEAHSINRLVGRFCQDTPSGMIYPCFRDIFK